MADKKQERFEATVAPGIDDQEELNRQATEEDIVNHETTKVTTLSYDEVNPS